MEGYNGHARPLDSLVRARDWRLFNVNNVHLARFKEIFPAAANGSTAARPWTRSGLSGTAFGGPPSR